MTEHEINSKVKSAFTSDIPDNFDEILAKCEAQDKIVAMPERRWNVKRMRRIIGAAAVAVVVFAVGIMGHILTNGNNTDSNFFTDSTADDSNYIEEDFFADNSEDASSQSDSTDIISEVSDKRIEKIVDESHKYLKTGNIIKFYEEDNYEYYTVSGKNDGIMVYFKDGTKMGIFEAFKKKLVKLSDLEKYDVKYIKKFAGSQIFDLTETYDCGAEKKTQEFYRDENFSYTFSSQKADYVKYVDKNGKTLTVGEALKQDKTKMYDIGNAGIDFDKKYIGNKLLIVNESEGYATTQAFVEFYRDDTYVYEFSDGRNVVVYYPDGTSQGVTKALQSGKIKVTDLDKFGIKYYTNVDLEK